LTHSYYFSGVKTTGLKFSVVTCARCIEAEQVLWLCSLGLYVCVSARQLTTALMNVDHTW